MRPIAMMLAFLLLGPAVWAPVCARSATLQRTVLFINAGTQPIYSIRLGHAGEPFGPDLLGPTQVVGIGEGQRVRVSLSDTCWYDVQFEYADGRAEQMHNLDLCSAHHVFIKS